MNPLAANVTSNGYADKSSVSSLEQAMRPAVAAAQAGDKANAYNLFQQIAAVHPGSADVWVWVAGTSPNIDEAESAFERAHALDPNNQGANLGLRWVALKRQGAGQPTMPQATDSGTDAPPEMIFFTPHSTDSLSAHRVAMPTPETGPLATAQPKTATPAPGESKKARKFTLDPVVIGVLVAIIIAIALFLFLWRP